MNIKEKYKHIVLLLGFSLMFSLNGFSKSPIIGKIHLDNNNGLSNSSINAILQDDEGVMWFGTWEGLNKYDGANFYQFTPKNSDPYSISHPVVRKIIAEDSLHLWIVTDWGLNRFNKQTNKSSTYFLNEEKPSIYRENAYQCDINAKGNLIAKALGCQFYLFNKKKNRFEEMQLDHTISQDIESFFFDNRDKLWVKTCNKLFVFEIKNRIALLDKVIHIQLESKVILDNERNIWMHHENRLMFFEKGHFIDSYITIKETISSICRYGNGFLIGTEKGCVVIDKNKVSKYMLTGFPISSLFYGTQNSLWVGTDGSGIYHFFPQRTFINSIDLSYKKFPVRAILRVENKLVVGYKGGGLDVFDTSRQDDSRFLYHFNVGKGRTNNSVFSLLQSFDGRLWIGTDGIGLKYYKDEMVYDMEFQNEMEKTMVYSIYSIVQSNDSTLYLGSSGNGLLKVIYKGNKVLSVVRLYGQDQNKSIDSNIIYALLNDKEYLWIGTRGSGLYRLNKVSHQLINYRYLPEGNSLCSDDIISLFEDGRGRLWIGTTQGLNLMENENGKSYFKVINTEKGFLNNNIHHILEDESHHIWVSTSKGISRINSHDFRVTNYTYKDGLQGNEFSDGSGCLFKKGKILYFGGVKGLSSIYPNRMMENDFMPNLILNGVVVDNKVTSFKDEKVILDHDIGSATFSFSILDYIENDKCALSYKLLKTSIAGVFDSKDPWINVGTRRQIIINKPFPGVYRLVVRQSNAERIWSDEILEIPIYVRYPVWFRWWAILIYMVLLICFIRYIYVYKKHRLQVKHQHELDDRKQQNREDIHKAKLRFISSIVGSFSNNITQIYDALEQLYTGRTNQNQRGNLDRIKLNTNQINAQITELSEIENIEAIEFDVQLREYDLMGILKYSLDTCIQKIQDKELNLIIHNSDEQILWVTDKRILSGVFRNLFTYIVKSLDPKSIVEISYELNDQQLCFSISYSENCTVRKEIPNILNRYEALERFETNISHGKNNSTFDLTVGNELAKRLEGAIEIIPFDSYTTKLNLILPLLSLPLQQIKKVKYENSFTQLINKKEKTIFLYEKNMGMEALIKDILEERYNLLFARKNEDALDMVKTDLPDLIIYDQIDDSVSFIEELRSNDLLKFIPIMMLSTKGWVSNQVENIKKGASVVVEKPFQRDYFIAIVENTINENQKMRNFHRSSAALIEQYDSHKLSKESKLFLNSVLQILSTRYSDEEFSVDKLAINLAISRTQLYRKMKQLLGITPNGFIISYRMKKAEDDLQNTDKTISEIISSCGFKNKAFFYREFQRSHNCSPKDYRQTHFNE